MLQFGNGYRNMHMYGRQIDRFRIDKHQVKKIFVDETLLHIDGQYYWLWIAYEPNLNKCLMIHLSRDRTILVCYQFFKQLRSKYGRKSIFTDGARWYIIIMLVNG